MTEVNIVEVRDAYKRYGSHPPVLRGLNLTVKERTIYGLLGPSGCGKTTLLSCIVGSKNLDSGSIKLGVSKRSEIGYMPQEVALFQEFTLREIFNFYGTIFGLESQALKKRCEQLTMMLELPPLRRTIGSLSGGQQRRVSLAVALLHNPRLLILDEPTVGLDPILCQSIWNYLIRLTTVENKVIIITTHYIEEAKQANTIGLMREGVLLSEDSPNQLMINTNCTHLEEAFLKLSQEQQDLLIAQEKSGALYKYPKTPKNSSPLPIKDEEWFNVNRFKAQLWKNVYWVQRNVPIMTFLLILPALQSFLYCISFGKNPENLPIGLVSDELQNFPNLASCNDLKINVTYNNHLECNLPISFTCQYIQQLAKKVNVTIYKDVETAKQDAARNVIWGLLYLSRNFTDSVIERLSHGLDTTEFSLDNSAITVWLDMTNYIISNQLTRDISSSVVSFIKDLLALCGLSRELGDIPIRFNNAIYGSNNPLFAPSGLPGFICSFAFYFTLTFTSGAIMMEKMIGLLERSMIAGMTRLEVVGAHLVIQIILMSAQSAVMLFMLYMVFSNPLLGDLKLLLALLGTIEFVGIAYGFLLTEVFSTEKMITYSGIGTVLTMFLITGIIWPIEGAHIVIKGWVKAFPVVAAVESYNGITLKGYNLSHHTVYDGFIWSGAWIVVFSLLAVYLAKLKKGN